MEVLRTTSVEKKEIVIPLETPPRELGGLSSTDTPSEEVSNGIKLSNSRINPSNNAQTNHSAYS